MDTGRIPGWTAGKEYAVWVLLSKILYLTRTQSPLAAYVGRAAMQQTYQSSHLHSTPLFTSRSVKC
jgi:hypothetical protein